ncbi:MAG TPA: DUF1697 domain-containing protein [Pyrinomonadaceae bacterium]|nr:DUF1697 domain-containing protein [Pyrinomonadaceae bacterium]
MPKYVAFLRGINVGGHNVKMEHLRRLFESQGFSGVETFIASGNVIFDSPVRNAKTLERKIERCLRESLGYEAATFIRSTDEVAAVAAYQPFAGAELEAKGHTLYIAFLADEPPDEAKRRVLALATEFDEFHVAGRELYWLCRQRISDSEVSGAALAKALGAQSTMRNSNTVRRLAAKYS